MFDDLIISRKVVGGEVCVYDVVDRIREQTDTLIKKLGALSGMTAQPNKQAQIDVLKKALDGSVEVLDVVSVKTFFVTPVSYAIAKVRSMWPYGTATLTCIDHKSSFCRLPDGNYKSLYLYSWMRFPNGRHLLSYAVSPLKLYAAKTIIYTKK